MTLEGVWFIPYADGQKRLEKRKEAGSFSKERKRPLLCAETEN